MADIYQITIITKNNETFTGKMTRRQPELINGFVSLALESGDWMYFTPGDVKRFLFTPVQAEQTEQPEEQTTE